MRETILNLIAIVNIFLSAADINGQSNNSITGFVFADARAPVANLTVELLDEFNRLIVRSKTDGSGRYTFSRLTRGRYSLRVLTLGTNYAEQIVEVEIVGISRGGTSSGGSDSLQQNFYLQAKRDSTSADRINEVIFAQSIPPNAQKSYEKADRDLKNNRINEGIAGLTTAIQIFPRYYLALTRLGKQYITLGKYVEARDLLFLAIEVNQRDFESQYALGYAYFNLERYAEAISSVRKSIELNSRSVNGYFLLGVSLKQVGKFDEALESLKKAKKLAVSPAPEIHWQLSLIYTNNFKDYSAAADELELYLKAKPLQDNEERIRELIKTLRSKAKKGQDKTFSQNPLGNPQ